jgi:large subunit ribosomal protein LP0
MPSITEAKKEYEAKLNRCFTKYSKVLFCGVENVRSQQIHDIRNDLRGKGELVMGKKTLQAKCVSNRASASGASELDKTFARVCEESKLLTGNSGLLFTNAEMKDITAVLDKHRVQAPARVGAVAPCDVIVPAGNTGMEPTMTSFFQALNIPTKITKGTVEIISDKKVLSTGDKVDNSTAALLQKLKISPFYYQLEILSVWDRGVIFSKADLSIDDSAIEEMLMTGIANVNALSLGAGIPTASSIGILVNDAFKNLLAISVATEYEFSEFNGAQLRKDAIAGKLGGGGAAAPAAAAAAPAAAAKPAAAAAKAAEPEEEEDDFGMGGLF